MVWGDLLTFEYGKPVSDKESVDGPVPVFGTNGQIGTSHLKALCPYPSFIVGRKGAYRGVHFSSKPFSVIDTAFYAAPISDKKDLFDIKWAYYKFLTYNINNMDSGSAIPSTDRYELYGISVELPPINTQKKIVKILDAINDKIDCNNAINKNLEAQASAIFYNQYISEQWQMATLQDISSIRYGKGLPTNKLTEDGYYVFGGNGIIGKYSEFMYEMPQILVSCRGAASGKIVESYPKSFVTNNSLILEWKDYRYYELMKQYLLLNPLYEYRTGSAQPQITVDNIKNVLVPYPEYKKVSELCNTLKIISGLRYQNIVQSIRLQKLRDSLLPRLMSGELDVSNVEI